MTDDELIEQALKDALSKAEYIRRKVYTMLEKLPPQPNGSEYAQTVEDDVDRIKKALSIHQERMGLSHVSKKVA